MRLRRLVMQAFGPLRVLGDIRQILVASIFAPVYSAKEIHFPAVLARGRR
jgi:hypothetical protein